MIERFTIEEINLICIFGAKRRAALVKELAEVISSIEDRDMFETFVSTINKLSKLTDAEFETLEFCLVYEGEDSGGDNGGVGEGATA